MNNIALDSYIRGLQIRLTKSNRSIKHDPDYEFLVWALEDVKKFKARKIKADKHLEKSYAAQ